MPALFQPVGMLRDYVDGQSQVEVQAGQTVRVALAGLGIPPELVAMVSVNEQHQTKDYILQDGDHVRLIALMGGG